MAELDFDDSEILSVRSEMIPSFSNFKSNMPVTNYLDYEYDIDKEYYYTLCSVDAHDLSSPYSSQFKVKYDRVNGKMRTETIAFAGAPKPYPNFTLKETLLVDCMKDSGHSKMKIYFDPECLVLDGPIQPKGEIKNATPIRYQENFIETSSGFKNGPAIPMYKLQIINLDRQQDQKLDIYVKRSLKLNKNIDEILPGD